MNSWNTEIMRELVYVSRAKLERFLNDRKTPRIEDLFNTLELSVASLFKFSVSRAPSSRDAPSLKSIMRRVDQVIKSVENSDNPALWWEEHDVQIGDWIQFDTRQSYVNTSSLFLSWSSISTGRDSPSDSILLLHGSARHIVGNVQFWNTPRFGEGRRIGGPSGGSEPQLPVFIKEELKPFLKWKAAKLSLPGPWPEVKLRLRNLRRGVMFEFRLREERDLDRKSVV